MGLLTAKYPPLEHELDAAWIIALWLLIHDGDPPPPVEQVALQAIEALSTTVLRGGTGTVGNFAAFQSRLKELGIGFEVPRAAQEEERTEAIRFRRTYCFVYNAQRMCITIEKVFQTIPGAS